MQADPLGIFRRLQFCGETHPTLAGRDVWAVEIPPWQEDPPGISVNDRGSENCTQILLLCTLVHLESAMHGISDALIKNGH